tara:strand:- start:22941 stop:25151 length:2211 start_codon:yes stop_codon:yes gene_type:complete
VNKLHKHIYGAIAVVVVFVLFSYTNKEYQADWFAFKPNADFSSYSIINMKDWLDAPAGKHGFVQIKDRDFVFEDGTKVKFWGVNICSNTPFVDREKADQFVNTLTFMGVNGVRFHKFTWEATDSINSSQPDSLKFLKMDYFQSKLKENGIYYGWSHIYGHKVKPGDSANLEAYSEIANLKYPWQHLNGSTSSLVNFAPDLQDLNIGLTVNMLNRRNPFTGLRYADDPALSFVEFQNEDDIFWSAIERALEQAPTYKAILCKQFSAWLKIKYLNDEKLKQIWRSDLPEGQSIAKENVYPTPNHQLFSSHYIKSIQENKNIPQHLLDKMQFLYEQQLQFYKRFEKAVRNTGYKGVIVSSGWQAGSGISHMYNLHTDYSVGPIDRHNYFGGGKGGHQLTTGFVNNEAMVSLPGSGLLGTGMQQVLDRPFAFSEWMSLIPNQWTAEASPLIAFYGMGLQGWDASYSFALDSPTYSPTVQSHSVYNVNSPSQMGLYPALAAMLYRNDISEGPILTERNVNLAALSEGKLGFSEFIEQGFDDKKFTGSISSKLLAAGKIPIAFTENLKETQPYTISRFEEKGIKTITSATGELFWDYNSKGYITLNTNGTKGVLGFTKGLNLELGEWTLKIKNEFAVVLLTSLDKKAGLDKTDKILITTIGRVKNTGMKYDETNTHLSKLGNAPILLEGIDFTIGAKRLQKATLKPLDHMGRTRSEEIVIDNNEINIEGATHKTMYYLLEFR